MIALPEPPPARIERLANGLTVCLLENRRAPVVTCALFYRAGARDEGPGEGGTAHFLEHMMFKGSRRYAAGEIDRRTQALGGANNAFTSHDTTAYYFDFAPDRWPEALAIESDRMAGLTLDEGPLASERQVVLEEIAMYEGEPWDALEQAVVAQFYGADHPYGLPVIGTRAELALADRRRLAAFHQRYYQPANAILVLAGEVGEEALEKVERAFGELPAGQPREFRPAHRPAAGRRRLERRQGEVARLMMVFPAPPATHADHPRLRLLLGLLAHGRASRLEQLLVDDLQLCSWISTDLAETLDPGHVVVAMELMAGADRGRVEGLVEEEFARLAAAPPSPAELARAQRLMAADWIFAHQRVHDQALMVGASLALFDLDHPHRQLRRLLATKADELPEVAHRWLRLDDSLTGWALPGNAEERAETRASTRFEDQGEGSAA